MDRKTPHDADQTSDESLMMRVQSGDHQAFAILVHRHSGLYFSLVYRMCGRADEAEDIVQDCFVKLWEKPTRWSPSGGAGFKTWFSKVVTNRALDIIRARKRDAGPDMLEIMASREVAAEQRMSWHEDAVVLEAAIQDLPVRQRAALNLVHYEQMSQKDAAEALGVGVKALESLLSRAKTGLKARLLRAGYKDLNDG